MPFKEDIRYVKGNFPELRFMYVSGTYSPIEELLENKCQAGMRYSALARGHIGSKETLFIMGLGRIHLPDFLDSQELSLQRRGLIAHELSHFCFFPFDDSGSESERQVDEEAMRRGFGNELLEAITFLENVPDLGKRYGYSSQEFRKVLKKYSGSDPERRYALHPR